MAYSAADLNKLFADVASMMQRSLPHLRVTTSAIATANATDAASAITLANGIRTALVAHFAEAYATGTGGHVAADATALPGAAALFDGVYTLESAMRQAFNSHTENTAAHVVADAAGKCILPSSAENGDITSVCSRLNLLKAAVNAHMARTATSAAAA